MSSSRSRHVPNALPCEPLDAESKVALSLELGPMMQTLRAASTSFEDISGTGVYVGAGGVALTLWHAAQAARSTAGQVAGHSATQLEAQAMQICDQCAASQRTSPTKQRVTFLEGQAGALALLSVLRYSSTSGPGGAGASAPWQEPLAALHEVYHSRVARLPSHECEVLYGRAGYLWALLFASHHLPPGAVNGSIVQELVRHMLDEGRRGALQHRWPGLMYQWHGSLYLGAAHGLAGILYVLLNAWEVVQQLDASGVCGQVPYTQSILEATQALVDCCFPSGNLPSSLPPDKDKLVQWCHGPVGLLQVLQVAMLRFPDHAPSWQPATRRAAQVLWERGLLTKGVGLCHGISGNAYGLLSGGRALARSGGSQQEVQQQLHRAQQMAAYAAQHWRDLYAVPDRPASLYEGLGGLVCLLVDLLYRPDTLQSARLPGFELPPG